MTPENGGFLDTPNQRMAITHIPPIAKAEDLAQIPLKSAKPSLTFAAPLTLGSVAEIRESFPPPIGDAVINDRPGLLLIVEKQPQGNTLDVTRAVEAALNDLRPGLKGLEVDSTIFRPATFIETALSNLKL